MSPRIFVLVLLVAGCGSASSSNNAQGEDNMVDDGCRDGSCGTTECDPAEGWMNAVATSVSEKAPLHLTLVDAQDLMYPVSWNGEPAITESNGAHNQGLGIDGDLVYTAAQDREGSGWLFANSLEDGSLLCASKLAPAIFGESETGRVHPGGGYVHNGWMFTVLSNHPSMFSVQQAIEDGTFEGFAEGTFVISRFRVDPVATCGENTECPCEVELERDTTGEVVVYPSANYHGMMERVEATQPWGNNVGGTEVLVYDIAGDNPWRCNPSGFACSSMSGNPELDASQVNEILEDSTLAKPQQCITLGERPTRYQLCTTFPTGKERLTIHGADPAAGGGDPDVEILQFFREELGEVEFPDLEESQWAEGIALVKGRLYLAGDADPRGDCGFARIVRPCTSEASTQVLRVYELDELEPVCAP